MILLNLFCALLLADDQTVPEVIRLKVGTEVVGELLDEFFDEAKGVRIRRVDDHSLLDIGFDQMLPEDARRLRARYGYMPDEPEPILVDAMKVRMADGTEFIGLIVEQGAETFKLRQGTRDLPLRRAGVSEIVPVKVDALEVYDGEELYARELAARNPSTPLDHYNVALYCESLQLWLRVKEHLDQVRALDPTFKSDIIAGKIKRADLRLQSGEDSELLAKVERMAKREEYNAALVLIDDFLEKRPASTLRADMERQRRSIVKAREKWLKGQVVYNVFTFIERIARTMSTDGKTTAKEARKRIESEGTRQALEMTSKWLKTKPEEVQKCWEDPQRPTVSPRFVSYGSGTWTLDVDAALKGLTGKKEEEDPKLTAKKPKENGGSIDDAIRKLLEQKKKEAEDAAEKAKKGPQQKPKGPEVADCPPTEDEWWGACSGDERTQYLLAWWAEHEPSVKIIRFEARDCAGCGGIGILRHIDPTGEEKRSPCPRCKTLMIDRIVRYK